MVITARFTSTCPACQQQIRAGDAVHWQRGSLATHTVCPEPEAVEPDEPDAVEGCPHCFPGLRLINVRPGTFTVVFSEGRRTIRVQEPREIARRDGRLYVKLLTGSNNETDYSYLGMVSPDHTHFRWSRETSEALRFGLSGEAVQYLLYADDETRRAAGRTYALESGNCYVCGRLLTVPSSVDAGIGPVCEGRQ